MASGDKIGTQDCKGYAVARMLQLTRSTTPPPGTWESVARTGMGRCPYERGSSLAPPLLGIMPRGTEEIHPRERGSPRRRLAPLQACRAQLGPTLKRQCVGNGRRPSLCAGSIPAWVLGRGPFHAGAWRLKTPAETCHQGILPIQSQGTPCEFRDHEPGIRGAPQALFRSADSPAC